MKKIFSILFASVIALLAVSCYPEDLTVFDLSKAKAPVLGSFDVGEKAITASFTEGSFNQSFNQQIAPNHFFVIKEVNGNKVSKPVTTSNKDGVLTASINSVNNALISLGFKEDDVVSFAMCIRASMQTNAGDNGRNGYVDSDGTISVSSFQIVFPKGSPYQEYTETSPWSVIGALSAYDISWDGDLEMWMTPDGNQHVAKSVTINSGDEFKFRKDQDWGVNMGGAFGSIDNAFEVTQDGSNIVVPGGVYDLWLDLAAGTATITEAYQAYPDHKEASAWSVIGSLSEYGISWDGDLPMITDGTTHVAQGVKIAAADEFKFRKDKDWGVNLGGAFGGVGSDFGVEQDGSNIVVGADGVYDLIVNPDAGTAQVVETLGGGISGKIGGDEPEPEKPSMWSLIGTINGTGWDTDFDMTNTSGDIWVLRNVALTADDEFKIRADHNWDTNVGGTEANDQSTIDAGNPYDVFKPVLGQAFAVGGMNIHVGAAGMYDVTFDYAAQTILIEEHVAAFSLIGQINGTSWNVDVVMTNENGVWTSPVVSVEGGFKIRFDYSWDDANTYGAETSDFVPTLGQAFVATQPGNDIKGLEAGNYRVTFNPSTKEVVITAVNFPEHLYMIGEEFGGWDWSSDGIVEMTPVLHNPDWGAEAEGQFWTVRYFSAGKGFKFCSVRDWKGDFWGLTTNDGFVEAGGNCTVEADGFYMVHVDLKREMVHVEPARIYGIGSCFGGWNEGMEAALFKADGKTLKATTSGEGEVRMYAASSIATSDWWTREFVFFDGKIAYRGNGGDQDRVTVLNGQEITLDFNAGTATVEGQGQQSELPETMYMIGEQFGNWSWDSADIVDLIPVNGKKGHFWTIRNFDSTKGFKFCPNKAWNGDFNTLGTDTGFTAKDGNCFVDSSGVYMVYIDTENKKLAVEPAKVYGIGDCFGGWTEGMSDALFTQKDGKLIGTTKAAGEIRLYAASSIAVSDWWTREFVFINGNIAYRGNGGDQERVSVDAGKTVTLDFNAGTATVQ